MEQAMKLDAQKTTGIVTGMYLAQIVCWAAGYFWHIGVPTQIETALGIVLSTVLAHVPLFANPTQAA